MSNGGPAPESVTDSIYLISKTLEYYSVMDIPEIDLNVLQVHKFKDFEVEIFDGIEAYVTLMKEIYDFKSISDFFQQNKDFSVLFDAMHAVTGPYATRILVDELGLPKTSIINAIPKPDFGKGHPDPNLTVNLFLYIFSTLKN